MSELAQFLAYRRMHGPMGRETAQHNARRIREIAALLIGSGC